VPLRKRELSEDRAEQVGQDRTDDREAVDDAQEAVRDSGELRKAWDVRGTRNVRDGNIRDRNIRDGNIRNRDVRGRHIGSGLVLGLVARDRNVRDRIVRNRNVRDLRGVRDLGYVGCVRDLGHVRYVRGVRNFRDLRYVRGVRDLGAVRYVGNVRNGIVRNRTVGDWVAGDWRLRDRAVRDWGWDRAGHGWCGDRSQCEASDDSGDSSPRIHEISFACC
jgi:hypothetical protein